MATLFLRRTTSVLAIALSAASVVMLPSTSSAFTAIAVDAFTPVAWEEDWVPVFLDPRVHGSLTLEQAEVALRASIDTWNAVPCAGIWLEYSGLVAGSPGFGITVDWAPLDTKSVVLTAEAAAITETYHSRKGRIYRADMHLNPLFMWVTSEGPLEPSAVDVQAVVTHELGHAIGLGHSRHREATMFFSGGNSSLRDLEPDDERGACYLYAATGLFSEGQPCDSCTDDAHCAELGGRCLYYPHGRAFCAPRCSVDADCPGAHTCILVAGGERLCVANNGHCDEAGGAIAFGSYCYGAVTCSTGYCQVTGTDAYCSAGCDASKSSSCPSGMVCIGGAFAGCPAGVNTEDCGVCVRAGLGKLGDVCWDAGECESGLCAAAPNLVGRCTQGCGGDGDCGAQGLCRLGVCVVPGDRPGAAPCTNPFQCGGGVCLNLSGDGARCTNVCSKQLDCDGNTTCTAFVATNTCTTDESCPSGECFGGFGACVCLSDTDCAADQRCANTPVQQSDGSTRTVMLCQYSFCTLLDNKLGSEGESCHPKTRPCRSELVCREQSGGWAVCRRPCNPGPDTGCFGSLCAWLPSADEPIGECKALLQGARPLGESCGEQLDEQCAPHLACARQGDQAVCVADCRVSTGSGCKPSESCVDFGHASFTDRGGCFAQNGAAQLVWAEPPPDPWEAPPARPAPRIDPPGGGQLDVAGFRPLADVSRGGGGCTVGANGANWLWWHLVVGLFSLHRFRSRWRRR